MAKDYPNRSDLRGGKMPVQAATGQAYGAAGAQMAAQKTVPMAAAPTDQVPAMPMPGSVTDLTGTSQQPNSPISAGMPFGPGPGPEVFGPSQALTQQTPVDILGGSQQHLVDQLRSLYSRHPNSAIFQLILELENQPAQ